MVAILATISLNDGNSIPWVAFGTGTALYGKDATELSKLAIDTGLTHLDGAQLYNNEETLGAGIVASGVPRSSLYVVTKLAAPKEGLSVKQRLQESLVKLKLDYVDLFLIHNPLNYLSNLKETWKELEELKKEGLTKSIGVSNFTVEHLKIVLDGASVIPAVNQVEYHPYLFKYSKDLLKLQKEHGIVTASYGGLSPIIRGGKSGPIDPILQSISQRLATETGKPVSVGQVLTKWLQQQGIVVVTTSSKSARLREFLEVPSFPDLTAEEIKNINEAGSTQHRRFFMPHIFGE